MTTSLLSCVHFSVFAYTNYHFLYHCKQLVIQHLFVPLVRLTEFFITCFFQQQFSQWKKSCNQQLWKENGKKEAKNPFKAHPRIDNRSISQIHNSLTSAGWHFGKQCVRSNAEAFLIFIIIDVWKIFSVFNPSVFELALETVTVLKGNIKQNARPSWTNTTLLFLFSINNGMSFRRNLEMEKYNAFVFTDLRQQQALKNCWHSFSLILNHRKPTQFTNNTLSDTKDVNSCLNQWYCSCLKSVNYTIWMVLLKYRNNKTVRLVCVVGYFENQWKYHHVWIYIVQP